MSLAAPPAYPGWQPGRRTSSFPASLLSAIPSLRLASRLLQTGSVLARLRRTRHEHPRNRGRGSRKRHSRRRAGCQPRTGAVGGRDRRRPRCVRRGNAGRSRGAPPSGGRRTAGAGALAGARPSRSPEASLTAGVHIFSFIESQPAELPLRDLHALAAAALPQVAAVGFMLVLGAATAFHLRRALRARRRPRGPLPAAA